MSVFLKALGKLDVYICCNSGGAALLVGRGEALEPGRLMVTFSNGLNSSL